MGNDSRPTPRDIDPNVGFGRVRITIEFLDRPKAEKSVIEMDGMCFTQEAGIERKPNISSGAMDYGHNGQQRISIKAWKGCRTYDTFQAETEAPYSLIG